MYNHLDMCDGYINQDGASRPYPPIRAADISSQPGEPTMQDDGLDPIDKVDSLPIGFAPVIQQAKNELENFATASSEERKNLRKPIEIYRAYARILRDTRLESLFKRKRELMYLIEANPNDKLAIDELDICNHEIRTFKAHEPHELLKDLMMATNASFYHMDHPKHIDGYTQVEDENPLDLREQMKMLENGELTFKEEMYLEQKIYRSLPDWPKYLYDRMFEVYDNEDDAIEALKASWQWIGFEEEIVHDEDRGFTPDTFAPSVFVTDGYMRLVNSPAFKGFVWWMSVGFDYSIHMAKGATIHEWELSVRRNMSKHFTKRWSDALVQMWASQHQPQDLWMAIKRFFHNLGLTDSHLMKIQLPSGENLYEWIEENENDLDPFESPPTFHSYTPQADIEQLADQWLEEIFAKHDEQSMSRSRPYIEAFWYAQMSGDARPADAGRDAWREHQSPSGNDAYKYAIETGATRREAMRQFWQYVPKTVEAIREDGLVLKDGYFKNWGTCIQIAHQEGFNELDRLLTKLKELGIGDRFIRAMEKPA
ncbi:MAG: hypothetical protein ACXAEN_19255 [Candidatus Thorarchaeota archaeon]|jgi:hypothetical protein